jgi:diphosphomevalonate decarboxylase
VKSTAIAPSNIALIKYWGKRNKELVLPQNNSISMCLSGLSTKTTVEFGDAYTEDSVRYDDIELDTEKKQKAIKHLDLIRARAKVSARACVFTTANFPMAAGLASSASGFAALTVAAAAAAGLKLTENELSQLARRGSGSASRSIPDGFVEWEKGEQDDGSDSYAHSIQSPDDDWGFRMLVTITSTTEKPVSSRAGMEQTVQTCPYYPGWLGSIEQDLTLIRNGIMEHNFEQVAQTAEENTLKMHALMIATRPAILYWTPSTIRIMQHVLSLRQQGLKVYFTMDGGPQVKIMCREQDMVTAQKELTAIEEIKEMIPCQSAVGARLVDTHLF